MSFPFDQGAKLVVQASQAFQLALGGFVEPKSIHYWRGKAVEELATLQKNNNKTKIEIWRQCEKKETKTTFEQKTQNFTTEVQALCFLILSDELRKLAGTRKMDQYANICCLNITDDALVCRAKHTNLIFTSSHFFCSSHRTGHADVWLQGYNIECPFVETNSLFPLHQLISPFFALW